MKLLLLGGSGQLGFEVRKRALALNFEVTAPVSSEVDVANQEQVGSLARLVKPDVILNVAAYTAVDKAETEADKAFRINREGAKVSALVAQEMGSKLVFVSTDYVFAGTGRTPLKETDPTGPINVYGVSKLAGEDEIRKLLPDRSIIVRTSSLHGQKGVNFVNTMLSLFQQRPLVKVVNDQFMSPTWAGWLAEILLDLCRMTEVHGTFHASGEGVVSWYDFARAVYEWSGAPATVRLETISTKEFGRPAPRPMYSAFDCSKLASVLGRRPMPWEEGLKQHLAEVGALKIPGRV